MIIHETGKLTKTLAFVGRAEELYIEPTQYRITDTDDPILENLITKIKTE